MTLRSRADQERQGPTTWVLAVLALAAIFASAGLAFSADEPISGAPGVSGASVATMPGLVPDLPETPASFREPMLPLDLLPAAPFGPQDKGGSYIDMGVGQPSRLSEREVALLELSRAAVEASRTAGTLQIPVVEVIGPPVSPEDASRMKLAAMAAAAAAPMAIPTPGTGAPSDFIGPMQAPATAPATERGK